MARTTHQKTCPQCGTEFVTIDRRQRFCSIACARVGKRIMTGADSPNWKGGRFMHDGYVRIHVRNHPRSSLSSSYLFEHILVMEQVLGRHLLPHERVHHKNGRRNDNRPENLELWHVKDPPGVRAADYHCFGCLCSRAPSGTVYAADGAQLEDASRVAAGDTRKSGTRNTQSPQFAAPPVVVRGECAWCHRRFEPKTDTQRCCSRSCARYYEGAYYFGGLGRGWKGGRVRHSTGYIWVFAPTHPRARTTPYVFEHILVMERILHRRLEPNERVHHRNGKRDDNRPENLELWRMKDPSGVRAADYHCAGCACTRDLTRLSEPAHVYRVGATLNSTWTTSPSLMM
jgi:hypothetical protein